MGTRDFQAAERIGYAFRHTPLGWVLVARSERGIRAILLGDSAETLVGDLRDRFPSAAPAGDAGALGRAVDDVVAALRSPGRAIESPLDVRGTEFQRRVWHALREIPKGETASYTQVAERIGAVRGARAVAQACRANMLAVAVPCHRVVRLDGSLAGYRWGAERKRILLAREAAA